MWFPRLPELTGTTRCAEDLENPTMTKTSVSKVLCGVLLTSLGLAQSAGAQLISWEQNPLDNVSSGSVRNRAPGNMVSAGVFQAREFITTSRAGVEIIDPAPPDSIRAQALADILANLFDQINQLLLLFENLLLARAGESLLPPPAVLDPPIELPDFTPDDTGGGTGGRR